MPWQGTWNAGTPYAVNDTTGYAGTVWICQAANSGQAPTPGTYWAAQTVVYAPSSVVDNVVVTGTPTTGQVITATSGTAANWQTPGGGGGGSGTVTSVAATDTSIVVSGTPTVTPTIATGTLDVIATQHPAAANWSNNSKKITSLANGSGSQDAAAFGQIPVPSQSNGLLAWNCDLNATGTSGTIAAGGTVYLLALWLPNPITISNIWWYNTTAGISPTASQCQVGIYNSSGSLAASSTTAAAGTGVTATSGTAAEVALSSSYAAPSGLCWVGMVFQAGTLPTILHCSTSSASIANAGRTAATYRVATNGTLVTTGLPGSITPSSNSASGTINFWVGVS